jgi:hypothetical protein
MKTYNTDEIIETAIADYEAGMRLFKGKDKVNNRNTFVSTIASHLSISSDEAEDIIPTLIFDEYVRRNHAI